MEMIDIAFDDDVLLSSSDLFLGYLISIHPEFCPKKFVSGLYITRYPRDKCTNGIAIIQRTL